MNEKEEILFINIIEYCPGVTIFAPEKSVIK